MNRIKIFIDEKCKFIVGLFFVVYLIVGISVFKDYGISWDEPDIRDLGALAWNYVIFGEKNYLTSPASYHGPAFEMFLVSIEKIFNLSNDSRAVFLMRHLVNFLLFYIATLVFYRLCRYRFRSWKMGLLGSLFLILSPRIFADSFYNSKDLAFLSVFIICIDTLIRYLDKKNLLSAFLHAYICAFLIGIRIIGIIVPSFTILFIVTDLFVIKMSKDGVKKIIAILLIYLSLLMSFTILFWPILWTNPIYHFMKAYEQMSHYPWEEMEGTVLYLGNYIRANKLPWHYIPVWILITTPLSYIVCFFIGCFTLIKKFLSNPIHYYLNNRHDLIFILGCLLPLGVVCVIGPVLYDGWRQMFFVYPSLLMVSLIGLTSLFKYIRLKFKGLSYNIIKIALTLLIVWNLVDTGKFMIKYHPLQNVYFNILAGKNMEEIKNKFELDYWGLSYRKALEYILRNNTDNVIKIYVANYPGMANALILTFNDRKRLMYVEDLREARFFLSNYRWHREEYPYASEYYSIKIDDAKIMVVYKF